MVYSNLEQTDRSVYIKLWNFTGFPNFFRNSRNSLQKRSATRIHRNTVAKKLPRAPEYIKNPSKFRRDRRLQRIFKKDFRFSNRGKNQKADRTDRFELSYMLKRETSSSKRRGVSRNSYKADTSDQSNSKRPDAERNVRARRL